MRKSYMPVMVSALVAVMFCGEGRLAAQDRERGASGVRSSTSQPRTLSLASWNDRGSDRQRANGFFPSDEGDNGSGGAGKSHDYREISDFFNVREANVNTEAGEWEFEIEGGWSTGGGGDDDFSLTPNIKYGLTDDMFIELEVLPLAIGDGGDQGNGDIGLQLFYQFARETDGLPAFAAWVEARFPTGDGSSKIDGELHFNFTKTLMTDVRGHLEGFVETANGGRGDEDENRRSFGWGAGIGFDYQMDDSTILTLNYLNSSSEEYGHANQNILEIGGVRQIADNQHVKLAFDIGLDGHEETPDFGVKIMWTVEW